MSNLEIFEELIKLELNVADLYLLFSNNLENYKGVWYKLAIEEFNHASILKTALEFYESDLNVLEYFINDQISNNIKNTNKNFDKYKLDFLNNKTIENAKKIALIIESSDSEINYNKIMINNQNNEILNVLKKLNKDDHDHYERILKLK